MGTIRSTGQTQSQRARSPEESKADAKDAAAAPEAKTAAEVAQQLTEAELKKLKDEFLLADGPPGTPGSNNHAPSLAGLRQNQALRATSTIQCHQPRRGLGDIGPDLSSLAGTFRQANAEGAPHRFQSPSPREHTSPSEAQVAADAKHLRALGRGFTSGSEEQSIVETLRGYRTSGDVSRLRQAYRAQHGRDLDQDMLSELGKQDAAEVKARLAGRAIEADAIALKSADLDEVGQLLEGRPAELRGQIANTFRRETGQHLDTHLESLGGQDAQKAVGMLRGDRLGTDPDPAGAYQPQGTYADVASGAFLWAVKKGANTPLVRGFIAGEMLESAGFNSFRSVDLKSVSPTKTPDHGSAPAGGAPDVSALRQADGKPGARGLSIAELQAKFADEGSGVTPETYARAFLQNAARAQQAGALLPIQSDQVLAAGAESTKRFRAGNPRPLEGLIVPVKNQIDIAGYPTTNGVEGHAPLAQKDAEMVKRLREAGAIPVPAGLSEVGFRTTDPNIQNPFDPSRTAGGSSGGSAFAVASGLSPIAVASDAGGSTRIPAVLSGAGVALLPTHGRVPDEGNRGIAKQLQQAGPIGTTAEDAAKLYAVMAGQTIDDKVNNKDLSDLTIGIPRGWNEHADPDVVQATQAMVDHLRASGATIKEVEIDGLNLVNRAQMVEYVSAARTSPDMPPTGKLSSDVALNVALAGNLTAADAIQAQKVRTLATQSLDSVLEDVDLVLTPATARTAPERPEGPTSDLHTHDQISRFTSLANMTGHPAVVFGSGYDARGLPMGVQAIGKPWAEQTLLRVANAGEDAVERKKPRTWLAPVELRR